MNIMGVQPLMAAIGRRQSRQKHPHRYRSQF
jgi:hypothetical protein